MRRPSRRRSKAAREQLKDFVEYAAFMEEPLAAALELTRGLNLAARGLDEANEARALGRIGRLIGGEVAQAKGMLQTLLKAAREAA